MPRLDFLATALLAASLAPLSATAAGPAGCIELKTVAEVEEHYVDSEGRAAVRLVPAAKVVPGTEVIWRLSAKNVCDQPASGLSIDSPVPQHMTFVADSAEAAGFAVSFSVDGERYASPAELTVSEPDGTDRTARAEEYAALRFAMNAPLPAGEAVSARYRAVVR